MRSEDLSRRTKSFAVGIIRFVGRLPRTREADVLGRQLLRSGTSVGANYREARRGRSRADFVSKLGVCEQESDETLYWLELLVEAGMVPHAAAAALMDEANQLLAILVAGGRTAKANRDA